MKRSYLTSLTQTAEGWEQQFTATALAFLPVEGMPATDVFFGDLDGKLPIHSLRLCLPSSLEESFQCEFNDQGNQRAGEDVESLDLGSSHLRVRFRSSR